MSPAETAGVAVPILAVAVGGGLIKRDQRPLGAALVGLGVLAVLVQLVLGHARPAVGMLAIFGMLGGLIADERGRSGIGLLGFSLGFIALLAAVVYT
jgi:hypothetical protein